VHAVWALGDLFDDKNFKASLGKIRKLVAGYEKYKPRLSNSTRPGLVLEVIKKEEEIDLLFSRMNAFYSLKFATNTSDSDSLAKLSSIGQLGTDISNKMRFFNLWIKGLDKKTAKRILQSPILRDYRHALELTRKTAPFTKSAEVEEAIALKSATGSSAFSDIYDILTSSYKYDFNGKKGLSQEEVVSHYTSSVPKLRESAYRTVLAKYDENSTALSEIYRMIALDWHNEGIRIRGYKSALDIRNMSNDIEAPAVNALLKVVRKNSGLFQEYFKLKYSMARKQGGKYQFSRFHLYAPHKTKEKDSFPYEASKKIVLDTYNKFDRRFYQAASRIFQASHVHSHPCPNKRGGAFCWGPSIMLNHTDKLRDVFTMMHEFGHGIHDVLAMKQNYANYHTSLPMAETASIFGEMVLASRLLDEAKDPEVKKAILIKLLDQQYASITRQAYFVIFEQFAHGKIRDGLRKEELDAYYLSLLKEQFGSMQLPGIFRNEWRYIPHIYHTPFYCYAYAWGNLMVLALYSMYKKQGKSFIDKYASLLADGGSKSAAGMLKPFGINPEDEKFWQSGFDIIKEEITELRKLFG